MKRRTDSSFCDGLIQEYFLLSAKYIPSWSGYTTERRHCNLSPFDAKINDLQKVEKSCPKDYLDSEFVFVTELNV